LAQVCDAVHHAHEHGVIHRDLKPGNILVEETGQPKVLDFGVARATDADLPTSADRTRTGQLVGTLRYMSPEQVAANPAGLDRRSDVYTLGVILFELLAGRRPYPLEDLPLPEAARVIREQEQSRLGVLDPRFRGDVETIGAKALEKDKARRDGSAADLAADIRRYLAHEPISACPPSALYQLRKFARRHRALVSTTAASLAVLVAAGAMTAWQAVQLVRAERDQEVQDARRSQQIHDPLERAATLRDQARANPGDPGKSAEARRAEALGAGGPVESGLARRVAVLLRGLNAEEKDRRMVAALDEDRSQHAEVKGKNFDTPSLRPRYARAFRRYGADVAALPVAEAARRVRASAIRPALLTALDRWAWYKPEADPERAKLWAVADAADDNTWRRRLRQAARHKDAAHLQELAKDARALRPPPPVLTLLGEAHLVAGLPGEQVAFLRAAQLAHPDDFWINRDLAYALLAVLRPPRAAEALGYFRVALALRPGNPGVQYNLGNALLELRDLAGAAGCYRRALALNPKRAPAQDSLGLVLQKQGDLPGAIARYRKALALNSRNGRIHYHLGDALRRQGDQPRALACFRRALELAPRDTAVLASVGDGLREQGDLRGAVQWLCRALAIDPKDAIIHLNLGEALVAQGDTARAAACLRRAIELDPKKGEAHYNLGVVLQRRGELARAVACYRRPLEINPTYPEAHCNLGLALLYQRYFRAALPELQTGHHLGSRQKDWRYPSAEWLKQCQPMIELDDRLQAVLQGQARPAGAAECIDLADFCRFQKLHGTAVRFFAQAFTANAKSADDLGAGHRYRAACSAALAGLGRGVEAARHDAAERARLRGQALEWLRADLTRWASHLVGAKPQDRAQVQARLSSLQTDPVLAGVRDASPLATLPPAERARWQKLWADVAATRAKAQGTK
jgi:tetratricopeptide (TPR) repeat protein